ncbi:MAG: hypothetical protein M3P93_14345 [Actinomycetota bacterium]|nr:hypothetical protein [Actinomycetota bacterium]
MSRRSGAAREARREERRERAESRRRRREREWSQPKPLRLPPWRRPADRPGHQASTAHVQSAFPAVAEAGLGARGVYVGRDHHGGSFVYDPWVLYTQGLLNDANTIVIGALGWGKSALSKTYAWRQCVFGRIFENIDPKSEYGPLVEAMGGTVVRLAPGGRTRLNPLTRIGHRAMRERLLEAVTRAMLDRPLTQAEHVGLAAALRAADDHADHAEVTIPAVLEQLATPSVELARELMVSRNQAQDDLRECALALRRLCQGPLAGMFDGPTTAGEATWDAPAVSLDLSAVGAGSTGADLALGITMVCATTFLDAKREQRKHALESAGRPAPKVIRTNDEAWRALPIAGLGEYYQSAFKLARQTGVQHWLVLHRFSDLQAAGDEGSRRQRLAEGLLSDASTTIIYHQHAKEAAVTAELAGLSSTEAQLIKGLHRGEALWRVGSRSFLVQHVMSELERVLVATDAAMLELDPQHEPELVSQYAALAAAGEGPGVVSPAGDVIQPALPGFAAALAEKSGGEEP